MDSTNKANLKNNLKISTASKIEQQTTATTNSANHSALEQAKPFKLKRRKNRSALAGW